MSKPILKAYFVGIGGIGMSALARWLQTTGVQVAGYDRTPSPLTDQLQQEGMVISFDEHPDRIPANFRVADPQTIVVYTPAIPADHQGLAYFKQNRFEILKRSQLLGRIAAEYQTLAVAGTHGKTTTSAMLSWLLHASGISTGAFLGGIANNFGSNLLAPDSRENSRLVVEADEFDRSFLSLYPHTAIVTSTDADHLDIYGDHDQVLSGFNQFVSQIKPGGSLVMRGGLPLKAPEGVETITYGFGPEAMVRATHIRMEEGFFTFDYEASHTQIRGLRLGMPGLHNIENALAALTVSLAQGADHEALRKALSGFTGVQRRFDIRFRSKDVVYIDDYAHHPTEIEACIQSVRFMFPGQKLTLIFQPHLFTRTRDFSSGFSKALSLADEVWLMEIYPARELPIPGIDCGIIFDQIQLKDKIRINHEKVMDQIRFFQGGVLLTMGAGDIDKWVNPITGFLKESYK
jgi:UDP-N-acetylmuramate--alanine ligase